MKRILILIALVAAALAAQTVIGLSPGVTNGGPTGIVADWILAPQVWFSATNRFLNRTGNDQFTLTRGSTAGPDTNDCTIGTAGCAFATDDYCANPGALGVVKAAAFVFYRATPIGPSTAAQSLWQAGDGGDYGLTLGATTSSLTNEIITVYSDNAGNARSAWCDAAGSITAGWHIIEVSFDASVPGWNIWLDGAAKPITRVGTPVGWKSSTNYVLGSYNTGTLYNFFSGTIHRAVLGLRSWSAAEVRRECQLIAEEAARAPYNVALTCQ